MGSTSSNGSIIAIDSGCNDDSVGDDAAIDDRPLQNGSATQSSILNYDKYNNSDAVLLNPAKYVDWDNLGRFQSPLLKEENKNNNCDNNNESDEKIEKSSFNNEAAIERNAIMLIDLLNTALEYDNNRVNTNRKHIQQPSPPQDKNISPNKKYKHISPNLSKQIYNYVKSISNKYHNVGFHTFEHASHVMLSACNICYMLQLCNPLLSNNNNNNELKSTSAENTKEVIQDVSSTIYDPWLHFTIVFAALLHDIDHKGVPNSTLLKNCDEIALRYHGQYDECLGSYAECNSITIGLSLLLGESDNGDEAEIGEGGEYDEFARILQNGLGHDGQSSFYKTVTDLVLCTDIASKERRELGMKKWKRACCRQSKEVEEVSSPRRHSDDPNHEGERRRKKKQGRPERRSSMSTVVTDNTTMSRESSRSSSLNHHSNNNDDVKKGEEQHDYDDSTALPSIPILYTSSSAAARAICEQIIQVADVSHTMQHFTTFTKWNKHLYHEVLAAYQYEQQTTDNGVIENQSQPPPPPHENWYESQIGFFDHYIIPLAQRLDSCNLFKLLEEDDSKHVKFAELAIRNKEEWIRCGRECTRLMVEEAEMIELPPPMPIVPLSSSSIATSDPCNATTPMRKSSNSEEQVVMRRSFMTSNDRSDTMKVGNTSEAGGKVEEARDRLADITLVQEGGDTMGDSLLDESNVESTTSPRMLHHDDLQSSFRSQSSFRLNDNDDNSIVSIPGTVETATSRVSFAGSRSSRQGSESLAKWGKSASSGLSYENDVDSSVNAIVPQLLVQQLIDSLRIDIQQRDEISLSTSDRSGTSFGEIHTLRDAVAKYQSAGSVQRHRGALLFVDISGFTKLSQNYPVEDFKTFINIYFTKIINQVTSFGGEVVKFAGDALYAIWTTSGDSSDNVSDNNTDDDTSHAMNIEKCTTCAIAINTECNNYKVSKSYNKRRSSAVSGGSSASSTQTSLRGQGEVLYRIQDKNTEYEERGSTLTVYCGVSEGIMVGIDVVANNRAEFFLVGRPLKDVAKAESLAGPGELVVSPSVYSLLKTNETKLASKLVFTSIESNFQRVDCPTSQSTIDDMLLYFKERGGASFVKSDAQSINGDLISTCSTTLEESENSSLQLDIMRLLESHRHEATRDVVGKFTAELRRVVILFISIKYEPVLPEDTRGDYVLLENFQNIYSIISESVTSRSGQVRQFINDDKGTVFIASFGLRGSVILHPSDIAIDAAKEAQKKLLDIMDIQCCVGITLGKIFCGETGSFQRYEYSLLGPSVNLSARLMAKGKWNQINCDEELKMQTGRRHTFTISGTHRLKGYDEPVPFFMPTQDKEKKNNEQDDVVSFFSQRDEVLDIVDKILQTRKSNHNESTTQIKPSILLVKGDEGKGKDAFISAVLKHPNLQSTSVILEANRCFHDDPFYCLIPIITRAILYHKESRERLISLKKRHKRSSVLTSFLANQSFQTQAYPNRTNIVPDELTPYLSLINDFVYKGFPLIKTSIEAKRLKEGLKVEKCCIVLSALIVRYLELRGKPCILAMIDMDKIDSYSKKVLNRILSTNANLLIIGGADDSTPHHDDDPLLGDTSTESFLTSILGEESINVETKNLQLLDKQTVFDLFKWSLRRDFSSEECGIIDQPEVHDKIFKLCGGMCHATSRLAHTFCTQYERDQNDDTSIDLLDYTHTFLNDTPSDFEEIIYFRTDQMKPEEQMLLKIASVAGFDQYSFSQNLLEAVFLAVSQNEDATLANDDSDNDYDSDGDFQVPSSIGCDVPTTVGIGEENGVNNMFQEDNFEQMLESLVAHNFLDEINVEMSDLSSMDSIAYRFRSDHERLVINGLMLQDQKKRTHFEVAAYYSSSFRRGGGDTSLGDNESSSLSTDITSVSATNWELFHVIALHYDLADVPIPAMLHYFDSSDALASLGVRDKAHGRLLSAYLMLEKVLHKASTIEVKIDESSEQRRHIAGEMIRTIGGDQLNDTVKTLTKLTKERIRISFDSDLFAFKKSLVVLQKFGQSVGTIEQNGYLFGSELYIQAILLLLLVLADDAFINLTSRLGSFLGQVDLQSMKGLVKREDISNDDDDGGSSFSSDASCLHDTFDIDDLAISFPAFSGLLTFYRDSPIGANQVQEKFLANLFVAVTQEANQMIHVLRTRCILSHLYLKHGNITQALEECEGIKDIYDHDRYSLDLVNTYGMDWCLICIATMASTYLFKGQIAAAHNNIEFLKAQMLKLDEFASSTKAMSKGTISSFHLLLDEFGSSAEIANGINATQYGYFFKPIGTLQEELANRELALSKNKTFDSSTRDLDLLSVLSSDTIHEINHKRPMLEQSAETLSDRGIEAVKAALCETEIRNIALQGSSTADTIKQQIRYCEAGLLYLRQSLGQNDAGNHERRKNYLLCLYQKTGLLYWHHELLQDLQGSFEIQVEDILVINGTEIEDAKSSLDECRDLSEKYEYPFMTLLVGKRYINLGLDIHGGEELIQEALGRMNEADCISVKSALNITLV